MGGSSDDPNGKVEVGIRYSRENFRIYEGAGFINGGANSLWIVQEDMRFDEISRGVGVE